MPMQRQYERCVTPTQCEESLSTATASDDEIPHLLRPNPSDNFDEEDQVLLPNSEHEEPRRFLVQGFPSPRGNHEIMNASPISSISACTRGDRSIISSFTNLLPPVTPSSRETSRSPSSKSSTSGVIRGATTGDVQQTAKKFRCKTPPSTMELSSLPSKLQDKSHLFLKAKPRNAEYASLSPVHGTSLTSSPKSLNGGSVATSGGSSSVRSSGRSSQRSSYKRREMSQHHALGRPLCTTAASNRKVNMCKGSSHRRSTSLNLPSSHSSCTNRRKKDDNGLWSLKEGRQVDDSFHAKSAPNSFCPASYDLEETKHHSNASHRRTVSFPDEVLRQSRNSSQKSPRYNDVMLESDDPALFSLIETTQARSDGRVFIATDVDPFLASSSFLSLQQPPLDCEMEYQRREPEIRMQELKHVRHKKKHSRGSSVGEKILLDGKEIHEIVDESSVERKCVNGKLKLSRIQNSSKGMDWKQTFPTTTLQEHSIAEEDENGILDPFEELCETFPSYEHEKELKSQKGKEIWKSAKKGTKFSRTMEKNTQMHVKHSKNERLRSERTVGQLEFQNCCIIQ